MHSKERVEEKIRELQRSYRDWTIKEEDYRKSYEYLEKKYWTPIWDKVVAYFKNLKNFKNIDKNLKPEECKLTEQEKQLLMNDDYYRIHVKPSRKPKKILSWWLVIFIVLLLVLICRYIFYMPSKTYLKVENFSEMGDPIQIPTTWSMTKIVEGETITVTYLAEYTLSWRVLALSQYWENIFERLLWSAYLKDNLLRYKDVGIWWWFLTEDDYAKRLKRKSYYRTMFPEIKSMEDWKYISQKYSVRDIELHFSHNHLIPENDKIKKDLRWIRIGDYVQIKGYLVSLNWDQGYHLSSSMTREDTWDWACETILVTDIKWLKEKK